MPRFDRLADETMMTIPGSTFQFSGIKPIALGATEYTLVTIILDISGSVSSFAKNLLEMVKEIYKACKKNPRSENLMLRLIHFDSSVSEIHGFRELASIDEANYVEPSCSGATALFDAAYSGIGASLAYAEQLIANDFSAVNAAVYIVTDGDDNRSSTSPRMIADMIDTARKNESLESIMTVLIGIDTGSNVQQYLDKFHKDAHLDQFIWAGTASANQIAKITGWISKSISSVSQSCGSGGPSQPIVVTI